MFPYSFGVGDTKGKGIVITQFSVSKTVVKEYQRK